MRMCFNNVFSAKDIDQRLSEKNSISMVLNKTFGGSSKNILSEGLRKKICPLKFVLNACDITKYCGVQGPPCLGIFTYVVLV